MADLWDLPGVPESALPRSVVLPDSSPEAPWSCRVEATVWWHKAAKGADGVLPEVFDSRRSWPLTSGALVRYLESPVGPYDEVLGSPVLLGRKIHVPFIAVDSAASVRGGRERWGLPKTLATFDGGTATGEGWSVVTRTVARGPELPLWVTVRALHVLPDGTVARSRTKLRGRVRLARVHVESEGPTLPHWLLPGAHWGFTGAMSMVVGAPR